MASNKMNNTAQYNQSRAAATKRRGPSAFTLLEVVFALALSLLLMTALLAAVDLYRQVATTGRDEVARAQLARAILRQIESDIRACRFSVPEDELTFATTSEDDDDSATSETEGAPLTAEDAAAAYAGRNIGVMGDATTLLVHLSRPPRPIDAYRQSGAPATGETTSDLRSVAYFLATPGAEGLAGVAGSRLARNMSLDVGTGSVGLARLAGDPLALEAADAAADVEALAGNTQLLAAEVDGLAFRYFDGIEWYDVWNSVELKRLPVAVEVTLSIAATANQSGTIASSDDRPAATSEVYRMVVSLAAAEPLDESDDYLSF